MAAWASGDEAFLIMLVPVILFVLVIVEPSHE